MHWVIWVGTKTVGDVLSVLQLVALLGDLGDLEAGDNVVLGNLAFGTASIDALGNVTQSAGTKTVGDVLSVSAAGGLTLSGDLGDLEANTSGTLTIQDANDLVIAAEAASLVLDIEGQLSTSGNGVVRTGSLVGSAGSFAIDTAVESVDLIAEGSIQISDADTIQIDSLRSLNGGDISITALGSITVGAEGDLEQIATSGDVTFETESVTFGGEVHLSGDIVINASGTVTFEDTVTLYEGADLIVEGASDVVLLGGIRFVGADATESSMVLRSASDTDSLVFESLLGLWARETATGLSLDSNAFTIGGLQYLELTGNAQSTGLARFSLMPDHLMLASRMVSVTVLYQPRRL